MLRFLTVPIFCVTLCMAGVLYKIKYDTRSLQLEAVQLRKEIALERQRLAVLKAEWSILTRPERIEQLAGSIGLKPLSPKQIISFRELDALPENEHVPFASLKATPVSDRSQIDAGLMKREEFSQIDRLIGSVVTSNSEEGSDAR